MIVRFMHPRVGSLQIDIGPDEIEWGYNLNTATFPTYGGEVIQILSMYVEDLRIAGTIKTYAELEEIYKFFVKYFTFASQGVNGTGEYNQEAMIFEYPHRDWKFEIQPLAAPSFTYSLETIAPKWLMQAHIVDATVNVEELKQLLTKEILNGTGEELALTGYISPQSGDPSQNPFAAPGTETGGTFKPLTSSEVNGQIEKVSDWYNHLVEAYSKSAITSEGGAEPAFGKTTAPQPIGEGEFTGATAKESGGAEQTEKGKSTGGFYGGTKKVEFTGETIGGAGRHNSVASLEYGIKTAHKYREQLQKEVNEGKKNTEKADSEYDKRFPYIGTWEEEFKEKSSG